MLKSLPVDHPEELVAVMRDDDGEEFTNPLWEAIRDRQDVFSGVVRLRRNAIQSHERR